MYRGVIGEKLHRNRVEKRGRDGMHPGHLDRGLGLLAMRRDAVGAGHEDDAAAARDHLLHVRRRLLEQGPGGGDDDHRHRLVDQCDGAVLHLARGIALGVDVGDLLELERALERQRIIGAAPEIEHVMRSRDLLGDGADALVVMQHLGHARGDLLERPHERRLPVAIERPARRPGGDGERRQHRELTGEGLGARDPDLGAGMGRKDDIRLARHRRFRHIDDRRHMLTERLGMAQGGKRVGGLARLRDEQRQPALLQDRLAIAEFRGDIDLDRHAGDLLEPDPGHHAGIEAGAAGNQRESRQACEIERQVGQHDPLGEGIEIAAERLCHHRRLLEDLLLHEVAEIALLDERTGDAAAGDRPLHRAPRPVEDLSSRIAQLDPVALFEIDDTIAEAGERDGVRAEIGLALAKADDERAAAPRTVYPPLLASHQDGERKGPLEPRQRLGHRRARRQPALERRGEQMRHHLGIRFGLETMPGGLQFLPQLLEILDDPVVHHRDPLGDMGMGIDGRRRAVRRPARMADADASLQRLAREQRFEFRKLALGAAAMDLARDERRHAGRVIAPVFEPPQRREEAVGDRFAADDADDAAHGRATPSSPWPPPCPWRGAPGRRPPSPRA